MVEQAPASVPDMKDRNAEGLLNTAAGAFTLEQRPEDGSDGDGGSDEEDADIVGGESGNAKKKKKKKRKPKSKSKVCLRLFPAL